MSELNTSGEQPMSIIKSIQRVQVIGTGNVTISPVNMAKTEINIPSIPLNCSTSNYGSDGVLNNNAVLTSATNLKYTTQSLECDGGYIRYNDLYMYIEIIEYV